MSDPEPVKEGTLNGPLAGQISGWLERWRVDGRPSRDGYLEAAQLVRRWRRQRGIDGLWQPRPLMATATLDDALGLGLEVIEAFAGAAGLRVRPLGLMQPVEAVVAACRQYRPDLLGLTVLQFDTEPDLAQICRSLAPGTRVVAGGPVFRADADLARRTGVYAVAADAAGFWAHLLVWRPSAAAGPGKAAPK